MISQSLWCTICSKLIRCLSKCWTKFKLLLEQGNGLLSENFNPAMVLRLFHDLKTPILLNHFLSHISCKVNAKLPHNAPCGYNKTKSFWLLNGLVLIEEVVEVGSPGHGERRSSDVWNSQAQVDFSTNLRVPRSHSTDYNVNDASDMGVGRPGTRRQGTGYCLLL